MNSALQAVRSGKDKAVGLPEVHRDWLELMRWLGYRVEQPAWKIKAVSQ